MTDCTHIFWTGGWDSTFRICWLLLGGRRPVQPIYVHRMRKAGGQRLCMTHELQAMAYMRASLERLFPEAAPGLLPLLLTSCAEVRSDGPGSGPSLELRKGPGLGDGWQYSVLGAVAARWEPPIELCIEKSDDGHNPVGDSLIPHVEPFGDSYRLRAGLPPELLDPGQTGSLGNFVHFSLPLLFTTRPQMAAIAEEHGFLGILRQSWSCTRYRPDETQCGECYCCRGRIRDGVWVERPFAEQVA